MTNTLIVLGLAFAVPALAQSPPSVTDKKVTHVTGTIEAIDSAKREVTVRIDGQLHTFAVKPDVKRFSELKVGDKLSAEYHEATLMAVRQPGEKAPQPMASGEIQRVPGQAVNPSGALVAQQVASVVVKAIDHKTSSVTVETSDGRTVTLKAEHPERLKMIKVGDKIDITYTEALIVRVE
jgi:Cu/Ag efflux protein CusF